MIRSLSVSLAVVFALTNAAWSQLSLPTKMSTVKTSTTRSTLPIVSAPEDVTLVDVSGALFYDGFGSPINERRSLDLGALAGNPGATVRVIGIGWDTTLETVGSSWASEAQIDFSQSVILTVGAGDDAPTPPGGTAYSSGGIVNLIDLGLAFFLNDGILDMEFYDAFDDNPGAPDATFLANSSLSIEFEEFVIPDPPTSTPLGTVANQAQCFSLNTFGSDFDTQLAVYNSDGTLLAANDDSGGLQSQVDVGPLPVGRYYVPVSGFATTYGPYWDVQGGLSSGNYTLNYPTGSTGGALAPEAVDWYSFDVEGGGTPADPPGATDLGAIATVGENVTLDTFGSTFDTEIGVYDANGMLVASNDDGGGGLQSLLELGPLDAGEYFVGLGGFNTTYAGCFGVTGGAAEGDFVLNYNGGSMSGALAAGEIAWFGFQVVPEPASMGMLVLGAVLLSFRRRR